MSQWDWKALGAKSMTAYTAPGGSERLRHSATLLRTLAGLGGDGSAAVADIARAMRRRTSDLSVARNELIKKGLVYAPARGLLAFTVPGMPDFVNREPDHDQVSICNVVQVSMITRPSWSRSITAGTSSGLW